ncbi:ribosome maturation factor RimP [Spirochaetia bacterium]|nr:ribosome maturation factor RimP [Spirochaetia bacterium]
MRFTPRAADPVVDSIEPVIRGLGISLVELTVSRHKRREASPGSTQVRLIVTKPGIVGMEDCSRVHHAILPRLELAFPGEDLYVEVSSPGIDRLIKDASELVHYRGRGIRFYRTDISDWTGGILLEADTEQCSLQGKDGVVVLAYSSIAKAKLDHSLE